MREGRTVTAAVVDDRIRVTVTEPDRPTEAVHLHPDDFRWLVQLIGPVIWLSLRDPPPAD